MQAIVTEYRTDIAVLALRGELDTDTAPILTAALADLLARPVPRIVVVVDGLGFCDSVGLSTFVTSHVFAAQRGGWVRFAAPSPFLRQLMETLGLTRYITMYGDVEQAVLAA